MAPPLSSPDEEQHVVPMDSELARRLLRYALPYRAWMVFAMVLVLLVTLLDLAPPVIVMIVIDGPIADALRSAGAEDASASRQAATDSIYFWASVYVGIIGLSVLVRYAQNMLMSVLGKRIMNDVRMEVFTHLQKMPMSFFDRSPVGALVTRISNDIEALNQLFSSGVVTFLADVVVLTAITGVLFWIDVQLALVTLSVVPFLLIVTFVFRYFARKYYREQRSQLARLNGFTQESIQGMDITHLFVREDDTIGRYQKINGGYLQTFLKTVFCYSVYFPALEILGAAAHIGILCLGCYKIVNGSGPDAFSIGGLYLFLRYLNRFFNPIRDMAERYNVLQSAMAASERIFRILDTPESIRNEPDAIEPRSVTGEVEFQNVSFSYTGDEYAVKNLSFHVKPGETVAIVGATGAGKSTVANLLTRFYEPQEGRILIDGRDLRSYDKQAIRSRMALVLQDPFLFTNTILANIHLGNPSITEERAIEAARRVRADSFIQKRPRAYQEELKERGVTLSVGERQLVSFARALAHEPDLLILDEATANIDTETERLIQQALEELLVGRTSIVIAHRLSTIQKADRILVFHKGELRESGNHRELLSKKGIYYRLYRLQFGDTKA